MNKYIAFDNQQFSASKTLGFPFLALHRSSQEGTRISPVQPGKVTTCEA